MEPHIANLLVNNDPPSQTIIQNVKESLVTPLEELAQICLEIAQLEGRLKSLAEKRDTIQKSIDTYSVILSPIRRLPSDILHEIFYHCLPIHRNSIMHASEAPMLLTRICSLWRSTALSSPRLWAQLHIQFCDNDRIHDSDNLNGVQLIQANSSDKAFRLRAEKTLQIRCDVVKEWLGRSGTCPLSISLTETSASWTRSELDSVGPITLQLSEISSISNHGGEK